MRTLINSITQPKDTKATPDETNVREFQGIIQASSLPSTMRQRRGIDVAAGCGQLKASRLIKR